MFTAIASAIGAAVSVGTGIANAVEQHNVNALTAEQWEKQFLYNRELNKINLLNNQHQFLASQKFNRDQMERANQLQIEQWQRENEYNDPSNQVQRLLKAGLNPNTFMGNSGNVTGNAANMSVANPVSGPSPSGFSPLSAPAPGHYQAPDYTSIAENLSRYENSVLQSKRYDAQNAVDYANVESIKANTAAIDSGRIRAEELHTYQLEEIQGRIAELKGKSPEKLALIDNLKVRTQVMLLEGQKTVGDVLSRAVEIEQAKFSQQVQSAGLQLQAQELQSKIAHMSYEDRLKYAFAYGTTIEESSSDTDRLGVHGALFGGYGRFKGASLSSNIVNKHSTGGSSQSEGNGVGLISNSNFSLNGELGGSADTTQEEALKKSRYEFLEGVMEPALLQLQLLEDFNVHYEDVRLSKALQNLSKYTNIISPACIQNFQILQRQFEMLSPSSQNPSGADTYMTE